MAGRRGLGMAVALAGLGVFVLTIPLMLRQTLKIAGFEQVEAVMPPAETVASPAISSSVTEQKPEAVRPVAPQIIALPPVKHHVLERIEPREPLSAISRAHVPSEGPPKEAVLHRPIVTQAGAFEAMGYHIQLPGLVVVQDDEMCGEAQAAWPCGIHARTAFRNWLRGRALACVVPPAPPAETVTTPCLLGKLDAGAWLVGQGWARVDPADERYAALGEEARLAGRGLYGTGPGALAPFNVTLPPMADQNDPSSEEMQSSGD